ncbi:chloride channel [Elasticomyces elasticus]|nr:chloride channel [Elasticomyces elasticus]
MSSSSSSRSPNTPIKASSSKSAVPRPFTPEQGSEDEEDETLLAEDPLHSEPTERASSKRKQKATFNFATRFLSSPFSGSRPTTPNSPSRSSPRRRRVPNAGTDQYFSADGESSLQGGKDANTLDWNVEGPGRRVGYDDMTAIDWIFEYAKERQRLRLLYSNAVGLLGYIRRLADASQIWLILIATGIATGAIAAGIDVASDWLGDLKTGYCHSVDGDGRFYLNKVFCCWGYESMAQCRDWSPWSSAFGINARAGSYIIEYIFFVILSIAFAACASYLVKTFSIYAKQSGIPEIKTVLGGFVIRRFMGAWTLVVKSMGLCLAVASGMWLGKEGPLVHVACCCANLSMKLFENVDSNEARKREVLSAAAASGISVAFGSPIGGVLFSLEQLSYYFPDKTMWQSFVCAMVAAVTLQALNPFRTGKLVLYQVTYHTGWHGFELVPFAILGVIGGLYGGLFIKLNMRIADWRRSQTNPFIKSPVLEVAAVALATSLVSFPIKFMRAQSSELVYNLFAECTDIVDDQLGLCKSGIANTGVIFLLFISAGLGFIFATITFGLYIPAGVLLPSMAVGALYGRAVGLIVEVWQREHPSWIAFANCEPDVPCVTPGTYAIIGAASALAGATRMTVSVVVIMFELTGALTYVLPIMIAVMISKWVGDAMGKRGIYESWIHFNQYPFLDNRDEGTMPDVPVSQIMTRFEDLVAITATGHTIRSLRDVLREHACRGFPVIVDQDSALLLGYISRTELTFALSSATSSPRSLNPQTECHFTHQSLGDATMTLDLRPWMDQTPITLNSKSSLQLTATLFQRLGLRYVLFADNGVLAGLLTKKDVWYVLNEGEEGRVGTGAGVLREEAAGEQRGLLGDSEEEGDAGVRRGDRRGNVG